MKFKEYCKVLKKQDTPAGDFACDVLWDRSFPRTSKNRQPKSIQYKMAIESYLENKIHADEIVIEAFESAWNSYINNT